MASKTTTAHASAIVVHFQNSNGLRSIRGVADVATRARCAGGIEELRRAFVQLHFCRASSCALGRSEKGDEFAANPVAN
jgi:hypothetical protein